MCDSMLTVKDGLGFHPGQFFRPLFTKVGAEKIPQSRAFGRPTCGRPCFPLQLDLVLLLVEEMVFGEMVIGVGADANLLFVFPAPVPLTAADPQKPALG